MYCNYFCTLPQFYACLVMAKPKELYIASTMEELNKKCEFDFDKGKSIKSYLAMVNKSYQAAEVAYKNNDEERAYILYMRYGDAVTKVRKTREFQQQLEHYTNLFGTAKLTSALDKAEKLSKGLKKRYLKLAESKAAKKLEEAEKIENVQVKSKTEIVEKTYSFPTEKLTCQELHQILYKDQKQLILMDIRSVDEYQDSHIIHPSSINVPQDAITPGSVPSKIEKGIPRDYLKVWNTRDAVDLVVILDWHSTSERLQSKSHPLRSLKDSIYKWEQTKQLSREPVILEGGYADWLETYPQFTSNPQVDPPDNKPKTGNINTLIDFTYTDLRKSFANSEPEEAPELEPKNDSSLMNNVTHPITNGISNGDLDHSLLENKKEATVNLPTQPAATDNKHHGSLYPKINLNTIAPKKMPELQPEALNSEVKPVVKSIPTFDRSNKPKQNTVTTPAVQPSPKQPVSPRHFPPQNLNLSPDVSPSLKPAVFVDRSTKPKSVDQSEVEKKLNENGYAQLSNSKHAEIMELEQSILQMKKDHEEKEKRVVEIEEKKRLHLLSLQAEMKRKADELAERETKAKNDLAATMRLEKPVTPRPIDSGVSTNIDNKQTPSSKDTSALNKTVSDTAASPKTLATESSEKENTSTSSTSTSVLKNEHVAPKSSINDKVDSKTSHESMKKDSPVDEPTYPKPQAPTPAAKTTATTQLHKTVPVPKPGPAAVETPGVPPPSYASLNKPNTIASDTNVVPGSAKKSAMAGSTAGVTHAPLKDEPSSSSSGLKRSFSSPNIAKMVQNEVESKQIPQVPSRHSKPAETSPPNIIPMRDTKPNFQEEQDHVVTNFNLSLRGVYGGGGEAAKCGLRNVGNTCYMNSVLQCMFNITQLADYFLTYSYRQDIKRKNVAGTGGKVAEIFAVLLRAVWSGQYRYLIPTDMKQIAGEIKEEFAGCTQEDSHEFLLFLLDGLHEDLNKIINFQYEVMPENDGLTDQEAAKVAWNFHKKRNESIIIELFSGQYKATVRCLSCGKSSRKFDSFQFLTLSLPSRSSSLYDLIRDFSKEEKLTGDNKWKCPKCKVLRNAVRTIEIWKLPPVLIIHLKRFVYSGLWRDKIQTNVSYPITGLDLSRFTCGPQKRPSYSLFAVSVSEILHFLVCFFKP